MSILWQFLAKFDKFCYNVPNSLARIFGVHIYLGFLTLRYECDKEYALKLTYNRKETAHILTCCMYT